MKPITIISCILCILLLDSCAASKNMEKQQQIDYSSELQQLRNSLDSLHIDIDKSISQISSKLDSLYQRVNELCKSSGKTIELSWWDLHKDKIYLSAIITMLITIFLVKIKKSYHL